MKKLLHAVLVLLALNGVAFMLLGCTQQISSESEPQVKNVIYMIGDGMGLVQVGSTMYAQQAPLALERAQYIGIQKTHSASSKVTDSAASGTALATGTKTYNGAIGVDANKQPLKSILERASADGYATGLIATYAVTHATPAAFYGHNESRNNQEAIAEDFFKTDIDLFVAGGRNFFEEREDGQNLTQKLKDKGYKVVYTIDEVKQVEEGKLAGMLADNGLPTMLKDRGNMLPVATAQALKILKKNNDKGFFIMVEGSQIDGGGHANNEELVIAETIDFDKAVKEAFDFADANPGTLVVVTADHETGGLTLLNGEEGNLKGSFSTTGHSGTPVPIYAYGAGAKEFAGIMDNTDIPKKIAKLMKLN